MVNSNLRRIQADKLSFRPPFKVANADIQNELVNLWYSSRSFVILSGPPGVGKTRSAEDFILEMLTTHDALQSKEQARITNLFPDFKYKIYSYDEIKSVIQDNQIKFVWDIAVLHPQYTYEDLIRGYRMITTDGDSRLEVREGLLGFAARVVYVMEELNTTSDLPQGCLILDEINRAPIGQLFGESLYSLDRRGSPVATPYDLENIGSQLVIPSSLFLLGTMNSVDRAVSGFDFALRRRFAVLTMTSDDKPIEERWGIFNSQTLQSVLAFYGQVRDAVLNATKTGIVPQSELVIGHSYYLPPSSIEEVSSALNWLSGAYKFQVLPILLDYQEQGLLEFSKDISLVGKDILLGKKPLGDLSLEEITGSILSLGENNESASED